MNKHLGRVRFREKVEILSSPQRAYRLCDPPSLLFNVQREKNTRSVRLITPLHEQLVLKCVRQYLHFPVSFHSIAVRCHTHTHTHTHIHTHTYTHTHTHTHPQTHTHTYTYTHAHITTHTHIPQVQYAFGHYLQLS